MESLYTKYRPQTFADVVGQAHVVTTLETGTQVEVFASVQGWARVKCGSSEGYIDERYLSDTQP